MVHQEEREGGAGRGREGEVRGEGARGGREIKGFCQRVKCRIGVKVRRRIRPKGVSWNVQC